jgi:thioredoxin 1
MKTLLLPALLLLVACGQMTDNAAHHGAAILGEQPTVLVDRAAINQALAEGRVLLKFGATWCPPCRQIAPELEELAKQRSDLRVIDVDVDRFPQVAGDYGVESIPMLVLLDQGTVRDSRVGFATQAELATWVDQAR